MNDNAPACTRWLYIDTLSRFVGPFLGFRVVNAANSNCRALLPAQAGADRLLSSVGPHTVLDTSFLHVEGITA